MNTNFYNISPSAEDRIIKKNEFAFCFPALMPIVPGHILISPIRPVKKFSDLTIDEQSSIFKLMELVKEALKIEFHATGFNHAWNEEKVAGQSVDHFHIHILPRKEGDTGITQYEPRDFLYRNESVENRASSTEQEIKEVTELMSCRIKALEEVKSIYK